jgi:hypothetical protein
MNDIDRSTYCGKCRKRLPTDEELEKNQKVRREYGQGMLEGLAEIEKWDYCVCLGFRLDTPDSINAAQEPSEGKLSHEDRQGFDEYERAVGLDPRIDRPLWCNDEMATRLVLLLQYPPEKIEEMYGLVSKHWRGTTPMKDRRRDMMELRKRGENVFGEAMWHKFIVTYSYPENVGIPDKDRLFYEKRGAYDVISQCLLPFLKREGRILPWRLWRIDGARRQRYRMDRTKAEWISLGEKIEALYVELWKDPSRFPFMSKLFPHELEDVPNWKMLLKILRDLKRDLWESPLRGLFSLPYLILCVSHAPAG